MSEHVAVRAGDEQAILGLLVRLAAQAARRYPPPQGSGRWDRDAVLDLVSDTYARKGNFLAAAIVGTTADAALERYLLRVFQNVLRDQARETELGKLISRLETILGADADFIRHTSPYDAWRLATAPEVIWSGDLADLILAARQVRGITVTAWNTSGPTPTATKNAIVSISRAALTEAAGIVRDADVARAVQVCVPAAPLDAHDIETTTLIDEAKSDPLADASIDESDEATHSAPPADTARHVWATLDEEERAAVPHLHQGERTIATILGVGRRTAAAIAASARDKVRTATTPGQEETVLFLLVRWATTGGPTDAPHSAGADAGRLTDTSEAEGWPTPVAQSTADSTTTDDADNTEGTG